MTSELAATGVLGSVWLPLGRAAQAEARERYTWSRVAEPVRRVYETGSGGTR